jgi:hypothetical protein
MLLRVFSCSDSGIIRDRVGQVLSHLLRDHKRVRRTSPQLMKTSLAILCCLVLAGCALPVPKTTIQFNPTAQALDIRSPKDVQITNVVLTVSGTNFSLTIGSYCSQNPVEVIRAAVVAQQNQMAAANDALTKILGAATGIK